MVDRSSSFLRKLLFLRKLSFAKGPVSIRTGYAWKAKANRAPITINLYQKVNPKGRDVRCKHCAAFGTRIRSVHTYYRHFQMSSSTQWTKMNVSTIDKTDQFRNTINTLVRRIRALQCRPEKNRFCQEGPSWPPQILPYAICLTRQSTKPFKLHYINKLLGYKGYMFQKVQHGICNTLLKNVDLLKTRVLVMFC